jgi:hypothetical protein
MPLPAQATLRHIAKRAMESLELDILKELDNCLCPRNVTDQERLAVWTSLWQMMFIYTDLLNWKPLNPATAATKARSQQCRSVTIRLLRAVAVFYSGQFRSKLKLERVEKCFDEITHPELREMIHRHYKDAVDHRDMFCKYPSSIL